MLIRAIKTPIITPGSIDLISLIDNSVANVPDASILVITSKIVALCENNVIPFSMASKDELVAQESDRFLPRNISKYGICFTITDSTLIPSAGIDKSNGSDHYVLWPKNAQRTANAVWRHLTTRYGIAKLGVIITDSTCRPFRRGTTGIALAHSGFKALHDYANTPDLFGRPFRFSQSNVAEGLAASAVVVMGEGSEQTPLCILNDLPFVTFQSHCPTEAELSYAHISLEEDIFAPFLTTAKWEQGRRNSDGS